MKTIKEFITIKELKSYTELTDMGKGHLKALKDVLGLLKTDKTKDKIIKEIEG